MALREVVVKRLAIALDVLGDSAYIMNMTREQAITTLAATKTADPESSSFRGTAYLAGIKSKRDRRYLADDVSEMIAEQAPVATATTPTVKFDRREGVHAGRIETGRGQLWDDDAKRDARYYD